MKEKKAMSKNILRPLYIIGIVIFLLGILWLYIGFNYNKQNLKGIGLLSLIIASVLGLFSKNIWKK